MTVTVSAKKSRQQSIARAKEDYRAAVASARETRETAFKQSLDAELAVIAGARALLAQSQAVVDEAADSVERRTRQADMERLRLEQAKLVTEASQKRKRTEANARRAEKESLHQAEMEFKAAVTQAMIAEVGPVPLSKQPDSPLVNHILEDETPPISPPNEDRAVVYTASTLEDTAPLHPITDELARLRQSLMELVSATSVKDTEPPVSSTPAVESEAPPAAVAKVASPLEEVVESKVEAEVSPRHEEVVKTKIEAASRPAEAAQVEEEIAPQPVLQADPHGRIKVSISRIATFKQLLEVENALRGWPGVKLIMSVGGVANTAYYISAENPSLLAGQFQTLSIVENAAPGDGGLNVTLKTDAR